MNSKRRSIGASKEHELARQDTVACDDIVDWTQEGARGKRQHSGELAAKRDSSRNTYDGAEYFASWTPLRMTPVRRVRPALLATGKLRQAPKSKTKRSGGWRRK